MILPNILLEMYFSKYAPEWLRELGRQLFIFTGKSAFNSREIEVNRVYAFYKNAKIFNQKTVIFDLGANHGIYTEAFARLGARRIVSVEPQQKCFKTLAGLRRVYGCISVVQCGVSDRPSSMQMFVAEQDVSSTFSRRVKKWAMQVENIDYKTKMNVRVVTLKSLVRRYGLPDYCKIDTEGFEKRIITSINKKMLIPAISFEFHSMMLDDTLVCIEHLSKLGYIFNFTIHGDVVDKLEFPSWKEGKCTYDEIREKCRGKIHVIGDIFARLEF